MPSLSSSSSSASFIPSISESRYSWNRNKKLKLYKTKNFCSLFLIPFDPFKTNNNPNNNKMNRFILLKDFWKKKHKSSKEMLLCSHLLTRHWVTCNYHLLLPSEATYYWRYCSQHFSIVSERLTSSTPAAQLPSCVLCITSLPHACEKKTAWHFL